MISADLASEKRRGCAVFHLSLILLLSQSSLRRKKSFLQEVTKANLYISNSAEHQTNKETQPESMKFALVLLAALAATAVSGENLRETVVLKQLQAEKAFIEQEIDGYMKQLQSSNPQLDGNNKCEKMIDFQGQLGINVGKNSCVSHGIGSEFCINIGASASVRASVMAMASASVSGAGITAEVSAAVFAGVEASIAASASAKFDLGPIKASGSLHAQITAKVTMMAAANAGITMTRAQFNLIAAISASAYAGVAANARVQYTIQFGADYYLKTSAAADGFQGLWSEAAAEGGCAAGQTTNGCSASFSAGVGYGVKEKPKLNLKANALVRVYLRAVKLDMLLASGQQREPSVRMYSEGQCRWRRCSSFGCRF